MDLILASLISSIISDELLEDTKPSMEMRDWLFQQLNTGFSLDEIKSLCFDIGVDYDNIAGDTKTGKIRELIMYCERHKLINLLIKSIIQNRPQ